MATRSSVFARAGRWLPPLVLGLLFVVTNAAFVVQDDAPKFTDHQFMALWSWREVLWPAGDETLLGRAGLLRLPRDLPYPPLVYGPGLVGAWSGPLDMGAARLSLAPFWLLWAVAMHEIGRRLGGPRAGLAVGAVAIASPFVAQYAREYFLDMPQAAMQALALWLLLRADGFQHRGRAVALGLAVGLAMLTKWSTALFLAVPLALVAGRVAWSSGLPALRAGAAGARAWAAVALVLGAAVGSAAWVLRADRAWVEAAWWPALLALGWAPLLVGAALVASGRRRALSIRSGPAAPLANLALAGAVAGMLTLPWFYWAALAVRDKVAMDAAWTRSLSTNLGFVTSFLYDCLPLAPALLPLGSLWAVRQARARPEALLLLVSLLGSALVLVASGHPKTRYLLGLVVYAGAIAGAWVGDVGPPAGAPARPSRVPRALPPWAGWTATAGIGLAATACLGAWLTWPGDAPSFRPATVAAPVGDETALPPRSWLPLPVGRAPARERLEFREVVTTLGAAEVGEVWGLVSRAALPRHLEDDELVEHLEVAALRAGVLFVPFMARPLEPAPGGRAEELRAAFSFFLARTRAGPKAMIGLLFLRAEAPDEASFAAGLADALPEGLVVVGRQSVPVGGARVAEVWLLQVQVQLGQLAPGERAPFARQPMGAATSAD